MIHVVNFSYKIPIGQYSVNTTSRSNNWSKGLSPFFVGPIEFYGGTAKNHENLWQFSKVYSGYIDENGNPSERYFEWASQGWNNDYAVRYPIGKGAVPLYSYWEGEKLSYIEARKRIYMPYYSEAVKKTEAWNTLVDTYKNLDSDLYLLDFDAYPHREFNMSWDDVINNESRKMGHAFVLAMMLEGVL